MKILTLLSILVIFTTYFMSLVSADTVTPVCDHQYSDFDGDGFGWENSATCVVTVDSEPPPTFLNRQTGQLVGLIRCIILPLYAYVDNLRLYIFTE